MSVHCQLSGTTIKDSINNSSLISPHVMHYVSFLSVNPVKYRRCNTCSETFHSIGKEDFSSSLLKIAALILNYSLIFALIILPLSLLCDRWAWFVDVLQQVLVDSFIRWQYWFQLFSQYNPYILMQHFWKIDNRRVTVAHLCWHEDVFVVVMHQETYATVRKLSSLERCSQ